MVCGRIVVKKLLARKLSSYEELKEFWIVEE
jgi:hypothetical protein